MEAKLSRKSSAPAQSVRSGRSRSQTPGRPKSAKSTGAKSTKSKKTTKSKGAYSKLNDADEIEMTELKFEPLDAVVSQPNNNNEVLPHDIYDNTSYIPNKHLRLMEIPMTSSLTFQKLLYYHGTYDIIHAVLMIGGILHKMTVRKMEDWLPIVSLAIMGLWMIIEYFRLGFGYKGNINETFTEIVAFLAFSFFALILSAAPVI